MRFTAACDELCRVTARGTFTIRRKGAKATAAKSVPLRTGTLRPTLAEGARVPLVFRVSRPVRRSLRKALGRGRIVTLTFAVTSRDAAGNVRRGSARSRIVR